MEMRFRQVNTSEVLVDRILASSGSTTGSRTDDLSTTVAVLGFNDAGKTSFFSALWTLFDRSITKISGMDLQNTFTMIEPYPSIRST